MGLGESEWGLVGLDMCWGVKMWCRGFKREVLVAETRDWGSEREAEGCKHAAGVKYVVVGFKAWLGFEMGSGGWRTECWVLE